MCGVFGYVGYRKNAPSVVLQGLKRLEYRGYDSWGIAGVVNEKIELTKRVGKIGEAVLGSNLLQDSFISVGHTRWATHGGVSEVNSHPHLDCLGKIAVVHNGIIENYETLKKSLISEGHKFISETDSEVASHLIEKFSLKNDIVSSIKLAFLELEGLSALVVMFEKKIIAVKRGSPLVVGLGKNENFVASDASALLSHTKKIVFTEDNVLADITSEGVRFIDLKSGTNFKPKIEVINWKVEDEGKGKYKHFMMKEIFEQPKIISNISRNYDDQIMDLANQIKNAYGTYLVGCGTAYHATLFAQYVFSKVSKRHVNSCFGSEFSYLEDFLTKKSLVLALSQSGETIDIVESVGKAKKKGVKIAALVNSLGSTLYRMADSKILLGAGPEAAVASTKAFTAKLSVIILLAYAMALKLKEGKKVLADAGFEVGKILENHNGIEKIAKKIKNYSDMYIVGRGLSHPIALEAALKIKEVSYIHAEGFAAGELKHGVIALVSKGTPCVVFAPNDETRGAVLSGAMELRARGGYIIGVSNKKEEVFDEYIEVKDCKEATSIPNIVTMQLLAYQLAVLRSCDPDKPRNLAKSVTVK